MAANKLLHVIDSLGRGGAEMLLTNTLKLLPEYEHVLVTLTPSTDLLPQISPLIQKHYCLHTKTIAHWPAAVWKLRKIIGVHKPLLVHAHLQLSGWITKMACPPQISLFYSIHNCYSRDAFAHNRLALPLERLTARRHHHLIGVSGEVLIDYQQYVPNAGTHDVIYNMVGEEFFRSPPPPIYTPRTAPLKLISVGTLNLNKNYPYTLKALSRVKHLPITLDIYGAGQKEDELKALAQQYELNNVRFMGTSREIPKILPQYHAYLISSAFEGFGIAPLEAMATGLPVLASDIPVFREVAGDKVLYFNLTDPNSLAQLLGAIFDGKTLLPPVAEAGRKHAHALYKPQSYKETLLRTYSKYI